MLIFNWSNIVTWPHLISRERELVSPLNLGVEPWILMYHLDLEMMVVVAGDQSFSGSGKLGAQE